MADIGFTLDSKSVIFKIGNYQSRVEFFFVIVASFTYRRQVYKDQKFELKLLLSKTHYTDEPSHVDVIMNNYIGYSDGLQNHLVFEFNNVLKSIPREEFSKMLDESVQKAVQERAALDKVNSEAQLNKIAELEKAISERMLASVEFISRVEDEVQNIKVLPLSIGIKAKR